MTWYLRAVRTRLALAFALALSAPALALAAPPTPPPTAGAPAGGVPSKAQLDEAQQHFFKGVELYNDADFANAIIEFKRAYEIAPDFHVLFNVGQACYQAQNYACALTAFRKYLADGGTQVPAKRRVDVEKDVKTLTGRVAKLEVNVNVSGATVTIDDEKAGDAPFSEALTVSQGKRKIVVTKPGYEPTTQTIELAGGDSQKIEIALKQVEKPPPPPPPPPVAARKSPLPWIGVGLTGALVVGATITGVVALDASAKATNRLRALGSSPADIKNYQSQGATFAAVTDVLGIVAIATAATTAVLFIVTNKAPKDEPKQAWVRPFVAPNGAGLAGVF